MHENTETPEDVDRQLATARRTLQDFEDGVDRQRLLLRLRTASPAHPVLLFRFAFAASVVLLVATAIVVMVVTQVNSDLARILAKFEMVLPLPEEVPALPAVLGLLAAFMGFGWVMATFAALALGRDAQMLPWEQKQHQKLVNEVTRLTTQKAVMERIRNTPAGARPRIATPVPVGTRRSVPMASSTMGQTPRSPDPSTVPLSSVTQGGGGLVRGGIGRTPTTGTSYTPPPSLAPPRPASPSAPGGFGARSGPSRSSTPLPTPVATPLPAPIRPPGATGRSSASSVPAVVSPHRPPGPPPQTSAPGAGPVTGNQVRTSGTGSASRPPIPRPRTTEVHTISKSSRPAEPGPRPAEPVPVTETANGAPAATAEPAAARTTHPTSTDTPARPAIVMPVPASTRQNGADEPLNGGRHNPAPSPAARASAAGIGKASNGAGGVRLGLAAAPVADADADEETLLDDEMETSILPPSGILGRARAGAPLTNRSTPYGSAGRVRLPPSPATLRLGAAQPSLGQSTRGGTPLGAPPKAGVPVGQAKPRLAPSIGFPGTPTPTERGVDRSPERELSGGAVASMFATPLPSNRSPSPDPEFPDDPVTGDPVSLDPITAEVVIEEDDDSNDFDEVPTTVVALHTLDQPTIELEELEDPWLADALAKADGLVRSFPPQATLELSREPNLPFTLVISRATPAMAVRAMVNFVEFLASIATPPRARIELVGVAHLDRSFHKNVEAALEPYFGGNLEVRPGPGQVDIRFTDPDPQWSAYPMLPR